jgi:hypothetical protein
MTSEQIAADIVSAFAVHNLSIGNGPLEAAPADALRAAIAAAVEAEREACAKIADIQSSTGGSSHGAWDRGYMAGRRDAAAEIRKQQ